MRYLHCVRPVLAKKLVEKFGAEVLTVIETRTAELQSVDGIGPKRRERIAHALLVLRSYGQGKAEMRSQY